VPEVAVRITESPWQKVVAPLAVIVAVFAVMISKVCEHVIPLYTALNV
jgi:hypothetical protein